MKKLFLFSLVIATSLSAWSQDNKEFFNKSCATAYRTGTKDILRLIKGFNNESINSTELSALSTFVSVQMTGVRASCIYFESPEARSCSDRYNKIYTEVRAKINAGALVVGNQTEVDAGRAYALLTEGQILVVDAICHKFQ